MSVGSRLSKLGLAMISAPFVACAGEPSVPESTTNLDVRVAPLNLPGLSNVCYGLVVENETPEEVWSRTNVCSDRFGNGPGGDISYVGPCDADEPLHTVTLTIESVTDANNLVLGAGDWVNPCPPGDGCPLQVLCEENADTPVTFNITVMRAARQGFFDIAVEFEDVFCSGKIDCVDTSGEPIELLFNEAGDRDQTAVVALACTGGPGEGEISQIHMSDVQIVCGEMQQMPVSFAEPMFGSCFDVGGGQQVISYGLNTAIGMPAPASADPTASEGDPTIVHQRIFAQHVLHDADNTPVWDADIIGDTTPPVSPLPYDVSVVYARLGIHKALVIHIDHTADYAATGPVPDAPAVVGVGMGPATWNSAEMRWDAEPALAMPAELSGPFMLPEQFDGQYLTAMVPGPAGENIVVYPWIAATSTFGAGFVVANPTIPAGHAFRWERLNDGHLIGIQRDGTSDAVGVWVAGVTNGWTATQLTLPTAAEVPAGHVYAGHALSIAFGTGSIAPTLAPDGVVLVPLSATFTPPVGDPVEEVMVGRFTPSGGNWVFSVDPVYAGTFPDGTTAQWDLGSQTQLYAYGAAAYADHMSLRLSEGDVHHMFRVYDTAGHIWSNYPTLAAAQGGTVIHLTLAGLVERINDAPALALFDLGTTLEPDGQRRLELGILGPAIVGQGANVQPLLTLQDALGQPATANGGWALEGVERLGNNRFLLTMKATNTSPNQWDMVATTETLYRWDVQVTDSVAGVPASATATLVTIQTTLPAPQQLGEGFSEQGWNREPGDMTQALIPGGCSGIGGLHGSLSGSTGRNQATQQPLGALPRMWEAHAGYDFSTGANPIVATTFGYGTDVMAAIEAAETSFASTSGPFQISLPPSATEGNQWNINDVPDGQPVWQHAVYAGEEALNCNGEPCNKVYYNTAIGFDPTEPNCTLYFAATASGGTTITGGLVPPGHVYPVLVGTVPLTGADPATEGLLCDQHPLGSPEFGITYTPATSQGVQFCHSWDGTALTTHVADPMMCNYSLVMMSMRRSARSDSKTAVPIQRGEAREAPLPVE